MKYKLLGVVMAGLFLTGCVNNQADEVSEVVVEPKPTTYSLDEVSQHNQENDCWLVIDKKVYEVTKFVSGHPGRKAILEGCGKDATQLFETRPMGSKTAHSEVARRLMSKFLIGEIYE
jgi:cytochrome b involved in lipid metabolism